MKKISVIGGLLLATSLLAQNNPNRQFTQDFDFFWTTVRDNYCYWDKKQTDWDKVKALYGPMIDTVMSSESFVSVLEKVFYELYDHHASLNTNNATSERLVPSGTDIWAEYVRDSAIVIEVKPGSGAETAGIRTGMQIVSVNNVPVQEAITGFFPRCLSKPDAEAKNFALRLLLAGNHSTKRKITVNERGKMVDYYPDDPVNLLEERKEVPDIETKFLPGNVGYILINNSLGENDLIPHFDSALTHLQKTGALILDMRNTPSGGITTVARAILGCFIAKEGFYQKHELTSEEKESGVKRSWVEIVSPRKPYYAGQLVILADHWTGSVGEGIVVGFDALHRAATIGTPMAALNGAIYSFKMPNTGIGFSFPAEKLFHVNGTPREKYSPTMIVDLSGGKDKEDKILKAALHYVAPHSEH